MIRATFSYSCALVCLLTGLASSGCSDDRPDGIATPNGTGWSGGAGSGGQGGGSGGGAGSGGVEDAPKDPGEVLTADATIGLAYSVPIDISGDGKVVFFLSSVESEDEERTIDGERQLYMVDVASRTKTQLTQLDGSDGVLNRSIRANHDGTKVWLSVTGRSGGPFRGLYEIRPFDDEPTLELVPIPTENSLDWFDTSDDFSTVIVGLSQEGADRLDPETHEFMKNEALVMEAQSTTTISGDGELIVFNAPSTETLSVFDAGADTVVDVVDTLADPVSAELSHDGLKLHYRGQEGPTYLVNLLTGKHTEIEEAGTNPRFGGSRYLTWTEAVSGKNDVALMQYDVASGETTLLGTREGTDQSVFDASTVVSSSDGSVLVIAVEDRTGENRGELVMFTP